MDRTVESLIHWWLTIKKETNKFCAKLTQVEGLNQNGMIEQDKVYPSTSFNLLHLLFYLKFGPNLLIIICLVIFYKFDKAKIIYQL